MHRSPAPEHSGSATPDAASPGPGVENAETLARLRAEVRDLVVGWTADGRITPRCDAWMRGHDPAFTRALAERGLIGLSWPRSLGGRERSAVARLVVTEELLRAGAPVAAHWIADRQIGPAVLRVGSEALQREFLPGIARGEVTFCLGMSETESGSDLASVQTRSERDGDGWRITGRKIWTTYGHRASHAYILARTSSEEDRHAGLTEFVVDMAAPGVTVRPIRDLSGEHHFNEVVLDGVWVPDRWVLGTVGQGWKQVTEQLAFERGGMERVLSTYPLLAALVDAIADGAGAAGGNGLDTLVAGGAAGGGGGAADPVTLRRAAGRLAARVIALRELAWNVAAAMAAGRAPTWSAAVLKLLGTEFEREVAHTVGAVTGATPEPGAPGLPGLLAQAVTAAPGFSIRGGTDQMLLGIIARGRPEWPTLGAGSGGDADADASALRSMAEAALRDAPRSEADQPSELNGDSFWRYIDTLEWGRIGIPERHGGVGGSLADLAEIVSTLGRNAAELPLVEAATARWALACHPGTAAAEVADASGVTVAFAASLRLGTGPGGADIDVAAPATAWVPGATRLVVVGTDADAGDVVAVVAAEGDGWSVAHGRNLAGEPRARLRGTGLSVVAGGAVAPGTAGRVVERAVLLRCAAAVGAMEAALALTEGHVGTRVQFGRPLAGFQAVAQMVGRMRAGTLLARTAVGAAVQAVVAEAPPAVIRARIAAARLVVDRAAGDVAREAHQLHGAMGITREHTLHRFTTRLWAWRSELGSSAAWEHRLGTLVTNRGEPSLWEAVTSRPWT